MKRRAPPAVPAIGVGAMGEQRLHGCRLASRASLSRADADRAVNAMLSAIGDALANGESVRIAGFGTFSTRARPARQGRNPLTSP